MARKSSQFTCGEPSESTAQSLFISIKIQKQNLLKNVLKSRYIQKKIIIPDLRLLAAKM